MRPRGGTTKGAPITLATEPSEAGARSRLRGSTSSSATGARFSRWRGPIRTSFDFLEMIGFWPGFQPDRPYQSWGTEYVYVVGDEPRLISLQHLLVMFMERAARCRAVRQKHWRQDWRDEDRDLTSAGRYRVAPHHRRRRRTRRVDAGGVPGHDSPRYEAVGAGSTRQRFDWRSKSTWRPLPRREGRCAGLLRPDRHQPAYDHADGLGLGGTT